MNTCLFFSVAVPTIQTRPTYSSTLYLNARFFPPPVWNTCALVLRSLDETQILIAKTSSISEPPDMRSAQSEPPVIPVQCTQNHEVKTSGYSCSRPAQSCTHRSLPASRFPLSRFQMASTIFLHHISPQKAASIAPLLQRVVQALAPLPSCCFTVGPQPTNVYCRFHALPTEHISRRTCL